ncbi:hypothetical protein Tco_0635655, partial [Tanacetum coccineum]
MEALTTRINSQFKEIKGDMKEMRDGCNKCGGPHPSISDHQSSRPTGKLPSTSNDKPYRPPPAQNEHVNVVFTRSGKTYDPPVNPNAKPAVFLDDSDDEANEVEKEAEPLPKKPTH